MARKPGWRAIKRLRCYRLEDVARLLEVHIQTVRNWITRDGLEVMKAERPHLIRGDVLIDFLKRQKSARKTKLQLAEFYCLKCRAARRAAGSMADCTLYRDTKAKLTALCCECETVMNRPVSLSQLPSLHSKLDLTITQAE